MWWFAPGPCQLPAAFLCGMARVTFRMVLSCSERLSTAAFRGCHMSSCYLGWLEFATLSEQLCSWVLTFWCPRIYNGLLTTWTWSLINKEAKVSHQTHEVTCGWTQDISRRSVYASSFPHCVVVADKFLPPNIPALLLFVSIPASPEPQAQHFQMSAAISSAHSSLFPCFSRAIYISPSWVQVA